MSTHRPRLTLGRMSKQLGSSSKEDALAIQKLLSNSRIRNLTNRLDSLRYYHNPCPTLWYDDPTSDMYDRVQSFTSELLLAVQEEVPMNRATNFKLQMKLSRIVFHFLNR